MLKAGWIRTKIGKQSAFLVIIVLSFFVSSFLIRYAAFQYMYDGIRFAFSALALFQFLVNKKKSFSWLFLLTLFFTWMIISTFINRGSGYGGAIKNLIFSVAFCMLLDHYCYKNLLNTISSIRIALEILMWINLICIILFPEGLYQEMNEAHESTINPAYFLGHRNNSVEVLIPLLGMAMIESHMTSKKMDLRVWVLVIASLMTVVLTWSANAILCIAIFVFYCFVLYKRKNIRLYNCWVFFLGSALVSFLLIQIKIQYAFRWLIVNVLHKSMTLSTRTLIWDKSVRWISAKPVLGYGIESTEIKFEKIRAVNSCHNYFLDFLYYGGIILTVIILFLLIMSIRKVSRMSDKKLAAIISTTFASYFLLWIATPIHRGRLVWMFMFWLISYHLSSRDAKRRGILCLDRSEVHITAGLTIQSRSPGGKPASI